MQNNIFFFKISVLICSKIVLQKYTDKTDVKYSQTILDKTSKAHQTLY